MDYNLFWSLNPKKLEPFISSFKDKQDNYRNETNFGAWLQGLYFSRAIASNFSKNTKYFEKPIDLEGKEENGQELMTRFEAWSVSFNAKMERGIDDGDR